MGVGVGISLLGYEQYGSVTKRGSAFFVAYACAALGGGRALKEDCDGSEVVFDPVE
jgi:hypothetical protein